MSRGKRRARGFTYIGLLALIALIGIFLAGAGQVTRMAVQRDHEADLLFAGREYRAAIGRYFGHYHHFPPTLAALLGPMAADAAAGAATDPAGDAAPGIAVFRAMRRAYRDPVTNSSEWTTIPAPDGGIMGIASASQLVPVKKAGFEDNEDDFEKAASYADWLFVYAIPSYATRRLTLPNRSR
ncbi:MAG TPA: type II secretion system protein [Steroidobacteraceae bacterium]|nr:type II secretion system protein [Steroidobacteraceae bacterium]